MYLDTLLAPLSDEAPCGPDLSEDDDFLDYYYEALARLPERYFSHDGEAFDRKSIDLASESAQIGALLARSRDLRLLGLEAQFQILAGRIDGFADCLATMAALLTDHWDQVHPRSDEDETERRNALELLNTRATVVAPLDHAALLKDRRLDVVTYHAYAVAAGLRPPRPGETAGDAGAILSAIKSSDNAAAVEASHAALTTVRDALRRIRSACITADRNPFGPDFDAVTEAVAAILRLLDDARPDIAGEAAPAADVAEDGEEAPDAAPRPAAAAPPPGAIASHAQAAAALTAAEAYFAAREPSSPALFLLRQSRQLIGRPLVEAMRLLMPEAAGRARIDFGSDSGFLIAMERMTELSTIEPAGGDAAAAEPVTAETRDQAAGLMSAVETFFRQAEPSSPIPILLFKAKTFLNRDFSAIMADLIPPSK